MNSSYLRVIPYELLEIIISNLQFDEFKAVMNLFSHLKNCLNWESIYDMKYGIKFLKKTPIISFTRAINKSRGIDMTDKNIYYCDYYNFISRESNYKYELIENWTYTLAELMNTNSCHIDLNTPTQELERLNDLKNLKCVYINMKSGDTLENTLRVLNILFKIKHIKEICFNSFIREIPGFSGHEDIISMNISKDYILDNIDRLNQIKNLKYVKKLIFNSDPVPEYYNSLLLNILKYFSNLTRLGLSMSFCSNDLFIQICSIKTLKELALGLCEIKAIPYEIGNLINLERLTLNANLIKCFPIELTRLNKLTHLHLGANYITSIPKEINNLINLISLLLCGNSLEGLPIEIGDLYNLRKLELVNNPFISIPDSLVRLTKLELLTISIKLKEIVPKELDKLVTYCGIDNI